MSNVGKVQIQLMSRFPNRRTAQLRSFFNQRMEVTGEAVFPRTGPACIRQITAALKRVRELEEQVRTIPELGLKYALLERRGKELLQRIQEPKSEQKSAVPQTDAQDSAVPPAVSEKKDAPSMYTDTVADPEIVQAVQSNKTTEQQEQIVEQESEKVTDTESEKETIASPSVCPINNHRQSRNAN